MKQLIWGIIWVVAASAFWLSQLGNPLDELALIMHAKITEGFIIDTSEDVQDSEGGGADWYHRVQYTFRTPDGREFTRTTDARKGKLRAELRDLEDPYPIQVEYLPDDPNVSRIKGDGSPTLFDWIWRKVGLGGLLWVLTNAPGFVMIRNGLKELLAARKRAAG